MDDVSKEGSGGFKMRRVTGGGSTGSHDFDERVEMSAFGDLAGSLKDADGLHNHLGVVTH